MAYGTVKVDNITFTNSGIDQTVTVSGIVQSISGNITATGTIQGQTIIGTSTVSGATVTGNVGVFTTVTGGSAGFTTVTGTTVIGTTANFVNGTFSTQVSGTTVRGTTVSGATVTGAIGQFTTLTGGTAGFTTVTGGTITGNLGQFTTLTGGTAGFTTVTGTTVTGTTANFVSGVFTSQVSGATVTGNTGLFTDITGGSAGFTTVTGQTVTGTTANFQSGVFTTRVSGATITGNTAQFTVITGGSAGFTTVTGQTVTGTTANFQSGVFTTRVSGASITGNSVNATVITGNSVNATVITGVTGVFTNTLSGETVTGSTANFTTGVFQSLTAANQTFDNAIIGGNLVVSGSGYFSSGINVSGTISGQTVTGTTANFQSGVFTTQISGATVTGDVGSFSTITGGTVTLTSGVFGTGTAAAPSIAFTGDSNTGIYSSGADVLDITTEGTAKARVDATVAPLKEIYDGTYYPVVTGADIGNAADQLSLNYMLGDMAFQNAAAISVDQASITSLSGPVSVDLGSAAAPTINFTGDTNTGIYSPAADQVAVATNGTGRLFVDASGNVGVGLTPASYAGYSVIGHGSTTGATLEQRVNGILVGSLTTDSQVTLKAITAIPIVFGTNNTERARIDSSGRLLVGTSTAFSTSSNALIQAVNTSGGEIVIGRDFALGSGSTIGHLAFFTKPSAVAEAARIEAVADALHSGGAPTRLVFSTTANGASSPTERMRITSDAYVRLAAGTGGIQFNGDTAAANALDDYEEGTWTPVDGSGAGLTFTSVQGRYTKVGNQVTCWGTVTYPTTADGNTAIISGLPFTTNVNDSVRAGGFITMTTNTNNYQLYLTNNATTMPILSSTAAGTTNADNSTYLYYFIVNYFV